VVFHLWLVRSFKYVVAAQIDVLVIASKDGAYSKLPQNVNGNKSIIDLVRLSTPERHPKAEYYGICW